MFGPIQFWRWKDSKSSRPKDNNTYVLPIEVVKGYGSDLRQSSDVVPALALFNASSEHSWISQRFAEKIGIMPSNSHIKDNNPKSRPLKLAWRSKDLGRYIQRTVFMVAPHADFDVLFAEMQEENKRDPEPTLFQRGIQRGFLKRLEHEETIPRVDQEVEDDTRTNIPTLSLLDDQLLLDTEGHKSYHRMDACNTRRKDGFHTCAIEIASSVKPVEPEIIIEETVDTNSTTSSGS